MTWQSRWPAWTRTSSGRSPADNSRVPSVEAQLVLLELRVTRIADLVLKVDRLLQQVPRVGADPLRAERRARMAWVLEHGRTALQKAADPT